MTTDTSAIYLNQLIQGLTSPAGLLAIAAFIALCVGLVMFPGLRWVVVTLTLYSATLAPNEAEWHDNTLAWPLEPLRWISRQLTIALLVVLIIPTVTSVRGWRQRLIVGPILGLFIYQLYFGLSLLTTPLAARGVMALIFFILILLNLGWGLSRALQTHQDCRRLLWSIVGVLVLQILGTLYQLAVNRHAILPSNRLYGTMPNPQALALLISLALPTFYCLIALPGTPRRSRTVLLVLAGVLMVLLAWTGSRTGLLTGAVGALLFYRLRLGRLLPVALIIGLVFAVFASLYADSLEGASRLFSTENTREEAWRPLWENFLSSPLLGRISEGEMSARESSYLSILASFGLVGALFFFGMVVWTSASVARLWSHRRVDPAASVLIDFVLSSWGAFLVAAVFEGFFVAIATHYMMHLMLVLVVLHFCRDAILLPGLQEPIPTGSAAPSAIPAMGEPALWQSPPSR